MLPVLLFSFAVTKNSVAVLPLTSSMSTTQLACVYASLMLHDAGVAVSPAAIKAAAAAAKVEVPDSTAKIFSNYIKKNNVSTLFANAANAAAPAAGAAAPAAAAAAAPAAAAGKAPAKAAAKEESENEDFGSLF
jgi:large subunit ribosomal protein LP1